MHRRLNVSTLTSTTIEAMSCCNGDSTGKNHNVFDDHAQILAELALDPTLQDCCMRDLEEQSKIAALKAQATRLDRSQVRQRLAADVFAHPPSVQDNDSDSEEDNDPELQRLREARMNQIKQQVQHRHKEEDYGQLKTVLPASVWSALEQPNTLCHFALEGSPVCDAADEYLSTLAHQYTTIAFLRCITKMHDTVHRRIEHLAPGPALVVCTNAGKLVGANLAAFGAPHDLQDELIHAWVKRQFPLAGPAAAAAGGASGSDDEDGDSDGDGQPCAVCGRTYPHEHVRSVTRGVDDAQQQFSDEDGDY